VVGQPPCPTTTGTITTGTITTGTITTGTITTGTTPQAPPLAPPSPQAPPPAPPPTPHTTTTAAARGGHAVPAGAPGRAAAVAVALVWLATVFAVAGERKSLKELREAVSDRAGAVRSRGERPPARGAPKHRR